MFLSGSSSLNAYAGKGEKRRQRRGSRLSKGVYIVPFSQGIPPEGRRAYRV